MQPKGKVRWNARTGEENKMTKSDRVWRNVPLFVQSSNSKQGNWKSSHTVPQGVCSSSQRVQDEVCQHHQKKVRKGSSIGCNIRGFMRDFQQPQAAGPGRCSKISTKGCSLRPKHTSLLSSHEQGGNLGPSVAASERQGVSQDPPCCLQTLTPRETSLKGSQHIHVSLNLMNVDAPPRELIFVYN